MATLVSVIIPCYNEEKYIGEVLKSLIRQDHPKDRLEVLFLDGGSRDRTRAIIASYQEDHPWIQLLDNEKRSVPFAMNKGIAHSKGEVIVRMDAHASFPEHYISFLTTRLEEWEADNVGVSWRTETLSDTPRARAIKKVLSHPFGVGNSHFRTGISQPQEVDTVPFGCYRKKTLRQLEGYNPHLTRNQDIELNKRLKRQGGRILLFPDLHTTYFARETFSALARNNFKNGLWNLLTVYVTKDPTSLSLRHFIPFFFVGGLLLPLPLALLQMEFLLIPAFILFMYFLVMGIASFRASDTHTPFHLLVAAFFTLHFSYGLGSLVGLFRIDKLFAGKGAGGPAPLAR